MDPEALDLAWRAYGKTLEQNDPRLFSIISNNPPVLIDKECIRVELTSSLQQDDLLRVKPQLMLFIKKEVKNDFLELETAIKTEEEEGPRKAFTATEKLEAMMQKNPALALLRQQFNLDID